MKLRLISLNISLTIGIFVAGCGSKPEPATPDASEDQQAAMVSPEQQAAIDLAGEETGGSGLSIDDEIVRLCPGVVPPRFAYDSARVKDEFRDTLVALAKCMNEGALSGRSLLMVGHADPRGEPDYNMALGGRRASAVRSALVALRVTSGRIDVSSRGDTEAKGVDEASWEKDRRVDIKLKAQ